MGLGVVSLRHEKRTQPKTGTSCPLSNLWCCSGGEVSAFYWPATYRAASRPPIDRSRLSQDPHQSLTTDYRGIRRSPLVSAFPAIKVAHLVPKARTGRRTTMKK